MGQGVSFLVGPTGPTTSSYMTPDCSWSLRTTEHVTWAWWSLSWMTPQCMSLAETSTQTWHPTIRCLFDISVHESLDHLKPNMSTAALIVFLSYLLSPLCFPSWWATQSINFLMINFQGFFVSAVPLAGDHHWILPILPSKFLGLLSFLSHCLGCTHAQWGDLVSHDQAQTTCWMLLCEWPQRVPPASLRGR